MTMGQLITALFDKYEQRFHDEQLAAVATEVTLDELLFKRTPNDEDDFKEEEVTLPYVLVRGVHGLTGAPR